MKKHLTLQEHKELGWKLKIIRDQLGEVGALIDRIYPRKHRNNQAILAQIEVDRLRTYLDTCVCDEYRQELRLAGIVPSSVYYPEINKQKEFEIGFQLKFHELSE